MKKIFFIAIVATSLFACQSNTKPAFDLANAKKEIEAANVILTTAINKGDSLGAAECYTTDGKLMGNNMPSITGKANLTSFSFLTKGCFIQCSSNVHIITCNLSINSK